MKGLILAATVGLVALTIAMSLCLPGPAHATHPRVIVRQVPQLVTLSTGVRVLVYDGKATVVKAPFVYAYAPAAAAYQPQADAAEWRAFRQWKSNRASVARVEPSLVVTNCAKCHSGNEPKGKFDITAPLSPERRLKAIRRVLIPLGEKNHMPKGKALKLADVGPLIQQLAGKAATKEK